MTDVDVSVFEVDDKYIVFCYVPKVTIVLQHCSQFDLKFGSHISNVS